MKKTYKHNTAYKSKADLQRRIRELELQLGIVGHSDAENEIELIVRPLLPNTLGLGAAINAAMTTHEDKLHKGSLCTCLCHYKTPCNKCVCNPPRITHKKTPKGTL